MTNKSEPIIIIKFERLKKYTHLGTETKHVFIWIESACFFGNVPNLKIQLSHMGIVPNILGNGQ